MTWNTTMKISGNGQVSIPAPVRARWQCDQVSVVDLGDHIVISPLSDDPIGDLAGRYAGRLPSTDDMRAAARAEDAHDADPDR